MGSGRVRPEETYQQSQGPGVERERILFHPALLSCPHFLSRETEAESVVAGKKQAERAEEAPGETQRKPSSQPACSCCPSLGSKVLIFPGAQLHKEHAFLLAG